MRRYVRLISEMGVDWGACINGDSPCDRRVMFEHDGCEKFEARAEDEHGP